MYFLSIYGSPHTNGFSSTIHDSFVENFNESGLEVKRLDIYKLKISPCIACGNCQEESNCIHSDDMIEIYKLVQNASGVIISSPLYFTSIPGMLKLFIDRFQLFWEMERRGEFVSENKPSFFISTGGSQYDNMFLPSYKTIKHYLKTVGCTLKEQDVLYLSNVDLLDVVPKEIKNKAFSMGREFLKKILSKINRK